MKKFSYSMQSILDLQYKFENQEKAAFREATERLAYEEGVLRDNMKQQAGYEARLKEEVAGTLDLKEIHFYRNSINVMKSRVRSQMMKVHLEEKNVEAARVRLQNEIKKRKTHERMKEKAFDIYKQEIALEESKEIDQLVSYRHTITE